MGPPLTVNALGVYEILTTAVACVPAIVSEVRFTPEMANPFLHSGDLTLYCVWAAEANEHRMPTQRAAKVIKCMAMGSVRRRPARPADEGSQWESAR